MNKDTLLGTPSMIPWVGLSPRCLIFDTSPNGNFWHASSYAGLITNHVLEGRQYVWVLKTPALNHFEIRSHYQWSETGWGGNNLTSLLYYEYRYEYETMLSEGVDTQTIYQRLGSVLVSSNEKIARFPVLQTGTHEPPDPRRHMVILRCKKGQPVTGSTVAELDLYRPFADTSSITPSMSLMLDSLEE